MLVSLLAYAGEKDSHTLPVQQERQPTIKRFPQVCARSVRGKESPTFSTLPALLAAAVVGRDSARISAD